LPFQKKKGLSEMKELTSYNRVAGYLNKIFDLLNEEFFENELSRPTITIQSTPRAYGHFTLSDKTWVSKLGGTHEINIGAGTLSRDILDVCATLLHEMCHYWNYENGIQDCSRGNTYHNKHFKATAESVGLIVTKSDKYGWAHTEPSDQLIEWILDHDIEEIRINRTETTGIRVVGGNTAASGGLTPTGSNPNSHSRKYICPCCGNSVRATKQVNVICGDCMEKMIAV
jgi:predicted SprT family Zn-dependent metalloprotease